MRSPETPGHQVTASWALTPAPVGGGGGHLSSRLLSQRRHCGQHCGPSFSPPSLPAPLSPSTAKLTLHNEEQAGVRAQRAFQECRVPCPGGPESGSWGPLAAQVRGCKFCDAQLTSPQGHSEGTWGGGAEEPGAEMGWAALGEQLPQPGRLPSCWALCVFYSKDFTRVPGRGNRHRPTGPTGTLEVGEAESLAPVHTDDWPSQD